MPRSVPATRTTEPIWQTLDWKDLAMATLLRTAPTVNIGTLEQVVPFVSYGARIYDKKPEIGHDNPADWPNPQLVYLIYISQSTTNKWIARHMYGPAGSDPDITATTLFDAAKRDEMTKPPRDGSSFVDLVWRAPCYLYFVLDLDLDPDHAGFIEDDAPELDPIQFYDRKPILTPGPAVYHPYDANRSFYNGVVIKIAGKSAFRCINYLKDENGRQLQFPQVRYYGFKILFHAPYDDGTVRPHDIDPDGQNQGPPADPPLELREMLV
jgi:hypothetical protein